MHNKWLESIFAICIYAALTNFLFNMHQFIPEKDPGRIFDAGYAVFGCTIPFLYLSTYYMFLHIFPRYVTIVLIIIIPSYILY